MEKVIKSPVDTNSFEPMLDSEMKSCTPTTEFTSPNKTPEGDNANKTKMVKVSPIKSDLRQLLQNMVSRHMYTNVVVVVAKQTFKCHMAVLQCYSNYFLQFTEHTEVHLPVERVTPEAFKMIYDWMISDQSVLKRRGILELFNAACFLEVETLKMQCWTYFDASECFNEHTACILFAEASRHTPWDELLILKKIMMTRISKFFLSYITTIDFLNLTKDDICTLFSSNAIAVHSELEVLLAGLYWLHSNWAERHMYSIDVMYCVRFNSLPAWFLVELKRSSHCDQFNSVLQLPQIKKQVDDGIMYVTVMMCEDNMRQKLLSTLERNQIIAPTKRRWVKDSEYNYYDLFERSFSEKMTFNTFLEYLKLIQSQGDNYWRSLAYI